MIRPVSCLCVLLSLAYFIPTAAPSSLDEAHLGDLQVGYCPGVVVKIVPKCDFKSTCETEYYTLKAGPQTINSGGTTVTITVPFDIPLFPKGCKYPNEVIAGACPAKMHETQDPQNNQLVDGGAVTPKQTFCPQTATVRACKVDWIWTQKPLGIITVPLFLPQCVSDPTAPAQANKDCGALFESYNTYTQICVN